MSPKKACCRCKVPKPRTLEYFLPDRRNTDGMTGCCRECEKARQREMYHRDLVASRKRCREYNEKNQELRRVRAQTYRKTHREEVRTALLRRVERNPAKVLLQRIRARRCKDPTVFCNVTEEDLRGLLGTHCPVLGIPFDFNPEGDLDASPSVDRINNWGQYTLDNVAVISYRANRIKNNGTAAEHRAIGERMLRRPDPDCGTPVEPRRASQALITYRTRARKKGLTFELTELPGLPERCPYLGIPLKFNKCRPGEDSYSLDRIDPHLGYVPGNVEWVSCRANLLKSDGTAEEHLRIAEWIEDQSPNRTSGKFSYRGETWTLAEWAKATGIPVARLRSRIKRGWSLERALETP